MASTLVYTSQDTRARDAIARVKAASRIAAERSAADVRRARVLASTTGTVAAWRAAGAVVVGHKIDLEFGGKWRGTVAIDGAAEFMTRIAVSADSGEFWPMLASGEFLGDVECW